MQRLPISSKLHLGYARLNRAPGPAMSVEALRAPRSMAVLPPSALSRTLRCIVTSSSSGSRGPHLAGLLRLAQLRRPALDKPQHGAFSTSRPSVHAASAANVDTEPATQPAGEEGVAAAPAAPSRGGVFQSQAYPFTDIEAKWQSHWDEHKTFRTPDFKDLDTTKPKFYALDMFPYPRYHLRPPRWVAALSTS